MKKFTEGNKVSFSMLYGGMVTATVTKVTDTQITLTESWVAEDTLEQVSEDTVYDKHIDENGNEYIITWEYYDHKGIVYGEEIQEVQDLLKDYKTEDLVVMYQSTKAEDLLSEIIDRNKGLIYSWARSYSNIPNYDEEDLVEEAVIACWKAIGYYNPSKGIHFSSCLKGFVTQCYNRIYQQETRGKRYNGMGTESYEAIVELNDVGCVDTSKCYIEDYSELEIQEFLDILEGTTKQVALLLLTGFSKREVAEQLQITPATTSYYVKKIGTYYNNYKMCLAI